MPSSYGPVLSPMNKVHGGGINKLPSVNQLVGQPAQHSSSSAPGLGPMGKVLTSPGAAAPAAAGRAGRQQSVLAVALPARQTLGSLLRERVVITAGVMSNGSICCVGMAAA